MPTPCQFRYQTPPTSLLYVRVIEWLLASRQAMPCPMKTSTCRNHETISSDFGRLVDIFGPYFSSHSAGPDQMERLNPDKRITLAE